jgi:peptidoglycan hydrolase-like protein with peptidoglycan-binding domain
MPVPLSNTVRRALADGHLTADEVTQLKQAVAAGQVKPAELATLAQKFGDLFDAGAGKALAAISPPQAHVVIAAPIRSLGDSRAAAEVLNGNLTLAQGTPAPKEATLAFQHGLAALSSRLDKPAWGLPSSGVDGGFGNETTAAVKAFQQDTGLPVTGAIDQRTALELEHQLDDPELIARVFRAMHSIKGSGASRGPVLASCPTVPWHLSHHTFI